MKSGNFKLYFTCFVLIFIGLGTGLAQSGMQIHTGISAAFSQDKNITPSGMGHYGHFVGVDGRLHSGGMYFAGGMKYYRTSLLAESSKSFFSNTENYNFFAARFGLGFTIKQFSHNIALRSKLFGVFNFSNSSPVNTIDVAGYEQLNDSSGGVVTGLGMDIGFFTVDLEYERGIINAFKGRPDSKNDIVSFSVGVLF